MKDPVTKHHSLATTGHAEGMKKGGHVHMHEHHSTHSHKEMIDHHPKEHHGGHKNDEMEGHHKGAGHGGKSIHHFHGGETTHSGAYTEEVHTDGGGTSRKKNY